MRLNLSREPESYVLIDPSSEGSNDGVVIVARPALSEIIEAAKADEALLDFGAEIRDLLDEENEDQITSEMIRTRG